MNALSLTPVERALALETLIREYADEADRECQLPASVAEALSVNGLYRIGAPAAYGGEEASPITQIETIETISKFDGSVGWNLMIGIENFGLIAPNCDSCKHMLEDPMVVFCSSPRRWEGQSKMVMVISSTDPGSLFQDVRILRFSVQPCDVKKMAKSIEALFMP